MRIGIVCPYSFDVPGGVQFHVRDLAEHLIDHGHDVSVLAPADDDTPVPPYVVPAGRAVPVPYNGSVARVNFGPVSASRVRRWLADGAFDVLHIHEPVTPSLSLLALWAAEGPIVGTFHTSTLRSRAMQAAYPLLRPSLEKISARIAVSEDARRTMRVSRRLHAGIAELHASGQGGELTIGVERHRVPLRHEGSEAQPLDRSEAAANPQAYDLLWHAVVSNKVQSPNILVYEAITSIRRPARSWQAPWHRPLSPPRRRGAA